MLQIIDVIHDTFSRSTDIPTVCKREINLQYIKYRNDYSSAQYENTLSSIFYLSQL